MCKRHSILVSKGLEYSLIISIFCSIKHLKISSGTISQIFFQQRKYMNRFKNLPIIINFIWLIIFIVSSLILWRKLVSFWILQIHNWLIWTKIKNLQYYWKHARDGNHFRKQSKVVECCRPVSGNVVFWLDCFESKFWVFISCFGLAIRFPSQNFQAKLIIRSFIKFLSRRPVGFFSRAFSVFLWKKVRREDENSRANSWLSLFHSWSICPVPGL